MTPSGESELLRAFRQAFEEANGFWNTGNMKRAYAALPDQLEYRLSPIWPEALRYKRFRRHANATIRLASNSCDVDAASATRHCGDR